MIPIRDTIPSRTTPYVNYLLILTCVAVFLLQLAQGERGQVRLAETYGMIPRRVLNPESRIVVPEERRVRTIYGPMVRVRNRVLPPPAINPWWTLLTCIFLHGGWLHIIGNMWFLYIFGDNVEDRFGHGKYLLFYLFCGLAGSVVHLLTNSGSTLPTIGASGAIAGVMGAYFLLYPHARIVTLVPIFILFYMVIVPAPVFLAIWFLIQFIQGSSTVTGVETGGVAWWAHIGGFAMGFALAAFLRVAHWLRPPVRGNVVVGPWRGRS